MALITLGTNATTTLNALVFSPANAAADVAQIANNIKGQNSFGRIAPGAYSKNGRIHFPGRQGYVLLLPGDYVAYDGAGWPTIVSAYSIANGGGWTHS